MRWYLLNLSSRLEFSCCCCCCRRLFLEPWVFIFIVFLTLSDEFYSYLSLFLYHHSIDLSCSAWITENKNHSSIAIDEMKTNSSEQILLLDVSFSTGTKDSLTTPLFLSLSLSCFMLFFSFSLFFFHFFWNLPQNSFISFSLYGSIWLFHSLSTSKFLRISCGSFSPIFIQFVSKLYRA